MKILILEDEIYNFRMLRRMLEDMSQSYNIVGPFSTVEMAREYINYYDDIDIIIADIQLSDGLSFDVLDHVNDNVAIIFTTAYEEYALKAFEYNSLSYLLKPIDEKELSVAINKAVKLRMSDNCYSTFFRKIKDNSNFRERFVVKVAKGEKVILLSNVRFIVSEHKTTYLKLFDDRSFAVDMTLDEISKQLNPKQYMRVNRKYIVPFEQVDSVEHLRNGKEQLHLKGEAAPEIIISRIRKAEVNKWLKERSLT